MLVLGLCTVACTVAIFPNAFDFFRIYDDEGTALLSTVLTLHGSVYAHSSTEYGPVYFGVWALVFAILHVPVTHDAGRTLTLLLWGLTAGLGALVVTRLTRSRAAGIAALLFSLVALSPLVAEPLQPACLIEPATAALVLVMASFRLNDRKLVVVGIVLTSIALCKINLGGYSLLGLCAYDLAIRARRSTMARILMTAVLLVPVLLMAQLIAHRWVELFGATVALSGVAVVSVAVPWAEDHELTPLHWAPILLGGALAGVVELGASLLRGETITEIVRATLVTPLSQVDLDVPIHGMPLDLVAVGVVLAGVLLVGRKLLPRRPLATHGGFRLSTGAAAGVAGEVSPWPLPPAGGRMAGASMVGIRAVGGLAAVSLGLTGNSVAGLSCAALVLVPRPGDLDIGAWRGRLVLAVLTVTLVCQTYPTAGSQLGFASFFVVLCGVVVLFDSASEVAQLFTGSVPVVGRPPPDAANEGRVVRRRRGPLPASIGAKVVLVLLAAELAGLPAQVPGRWQGYLASAPLPLPGSGMMRLAPQDERPLVATTHFVESHCESLVTLPTMDSFYLWTGLKRPPGFILPDGALWLEHGYQSRVAPDLASDPGLCVIRSSVVDAVYHKGSPLPYTGPLFDVLHKDFVLVKVIGIYRILHHVAARS